MTDNEIIKALECLKGEGVVCAECEYKKRYPFGVCRQKVASDTLDLVHRQKAEIDTLKAERDNYKEWYLSLANEVNKFPCKTVVGNNSEIHSKTAKDYDNLIADIKSEAIKEFAERLKENFLDLKVQPKGKRKTVPVEEYIMLSTWLLHTVAIQEIDNLVKEMTEGKDNA